MAQTYTKISALSKGLTILNIIGSSPTPIMARDIADQAGVTYSTAMNNIITLEDAGFIEKQGSGYIGSFKLASIWTNRMSYLKRRKQVIQDEIEVLERGEQSEDCQIPDRIGRNQNLHRLEMHNEL